MNLSKMKKTKNALLFTLAGALVLSMSLLFADMGSSTGTNRVNAAEETSIEEETVTVQEETTLSEETTPEETTAEETTTAEEETTTVSSLIGCTIEVGNYKYKITGDDTVTLKGFSDGNTVKNVIVANTVSYNGVKYKVTKIGKQAFKGQTGITKVTVRNNVTEIGKGAFYGCKKLKKVTIRTGVTIIRSNAFKNCSKLKTVNITSTVLAEVKKDAFKGVKTGAVINVMTKKVSTVLKTVVPAYVDINRM